jgi:hypothetical protein
MRDTFVHVDDVRFPGGDEFPERADAAEVELIAERKAGEVDVALMRFALEHIIRTADDRDLVSALPKTGCSLEHLVHRAGVELIELQDLEDPHGRAS